MMMSSSSLMQGPLSKWTNVMKGWQYRWFVLDDAAGLFSYYTSKEKMMRGVRRGCVRLRGAVIGIDDEDEATFTVTVDGKTFHFQANDSEERERWIRALEDTVLRHNQMRRATNRKLTHSAANASIADFDKKLSETDAYLELLLAQTRSLQAKADASETEEAKNKYEEILDKTRDVTESIKHAIVLLQIAKNATLPEANAGQAKYFSGNAVIERPPPQSKVDKVLHRTAIQTGIEFATECKEKPAGNQGDSIADAAVKHQNKASAIPEFSYSSSEDEDFYDADEEFGPPSSSHHKEKKHLFSSSPPSAVAIPPSSFPSEFATPAEVEPVLVQSPLTPTGDNIDYDALYEDEDMQEMDMKSHGSVITHLLSQVRIGMDLTKIVLPTFILERRSLLEMYSDFFAHPDIFVEINDGKSPEDRMVRVLKWYLSSFHAGRKSTIAKKPYNPIIGETFRCHWKLDEENPGPAVTEGPLPWCGSNDLTFVAEQVSHHPPISAFYAEHASKRISVNAHIYTKSSFLGMSVAVHNVGQGKLTLMDHNEEYICTFPSCYGRSILTVPWIELGGKVTITCPKTNYLANIEFKCKQFFSSDVNKFTAEVIAPGSKKPLVKVDGEWNGKIMAKWATGRNEVFIDVPNTPIWPKSVKSVAEQHRFESRRLWKSVTHGLKVGDIDAATTAKQELEQRQREEAAERKEKAEKWETKLFQPIGENWQYMTPLEKRRLDEAGKN